MTSAHYIKVGKDQVISKSHTGDETIDVIGKGAFSRVFRGRFDDKDVAVKRVYKDDYKSKELEFLRSFQHENIVRYLYTDFDKEFMYIVMEKCDCTLQQFIGDVSFQKKVYISPTEILRQTTNGLAYLHNIKHTIHRDLKPLNTLLLLRDQKWVVRIADFGISKQLPQSRSKITLTSIKGTVGYAAPEVLNNEKISKKSDIFSLGILFYFALSGGEHPYGTDMLKMQVGIRDGEQPLMGLLDKKYADDAKFLISSMIAHKCEDRFDITEVQSHHLFWNNEKKLNFIQVVSDYAIAKNTSNVISTKLNENSELVIGNSWRDPVYAKSSVIEKELKKMRLRKHGDDIMSLLRNIRNLKNHFDEKPTEFRYLMANGGFVNDMEFFFNMFPALISHVYEVMRSEERKKYIFKSFFYASQDMNTIKEADGASISSSNISVSESANPDMKTTMDADSASKPFSNISESEGTNSGIEADSADISSSNISVSVNTYQVMKTVYEETLMQSAQSGSLSEGTNPDMNTIKEAGIASTSSSNISESENNQKNDAEMKILMEAWCQFIDSRAKHNADQESFGIWGSELKIEEFSDRLNSTHYNLRASKSCIEIILAFIYAFIYLVVLMLTCFPTHGLVGLLIAPLSAYFFTTSSIPSTRFKKDWIYTYYLKLRLKLWKIPPPAPDNDMLNPKCIYVPLNKHQAGNWGEWVTAVILPTLQRELRITDMKELESTIKNAECSLNDFQKYSLWVDGVMGPLGNVPLWLFWLLGVVGLLILTISALYYESDIAKFVSLSGVAALIKIIYGFVKSNKGNVEPDIEANVNILDVICRLHRVIKKETIFFAVVANERDDFNVISIEYRRYFKFLIVRIDDLPAIFPNYLFDMDWLKYNDMKHNIRDPLADIIFNYIINKRFIAESEECENTYEFLRLLHKINNDNNNILSNWSMLHLVHATAMLSYLDSGAIDLELFLAFDGYSRPVIISHLDLQAMELYTTPTKLMIEWFKNKAYIIGRSHYINVDFCNDCEPENMGLK